MGRYSFTVRRVLIAVSASERGRSVVFAIILPPGFVLFTFIGNLNSFFSVERYSVEPASRQANMLGTSVGESGLAVIVIEEYFLVGVFSGG